MTQRYVYRIERGVAIIEVSGEQTLDGTVEVNARLFADPAFRVDMPKIYDTRRQTSFIGLKDMIRLRDELGRLNPSRGVKRRLGFVAHDAMVEKVMKLYGEIYQLSAESGALDIKVFTSLDEAEAWARSGEART